MALTAVLVHWRRIGEELKNALATQEGLEGVGATDMMRMQEAVMAVDAEGGKALKAAVVFEVQEAKRRREQMKEAAVHRAKEEKLMAERKVKEEKLRTEVVQPAMDAFLVGEAEELDKVARDWICADAVVRIVAGAGGWGVYGKTAVQAAVAAWRRLEASQTEQSVWDTKANQSGVVHGVLAFDPTERGKEQSGQSRRQSEYEGETPAKPAPPTTSAAPGNSDASASTATPPPSQVMVGNPYAPGALHTRRRIEASNERLTPRRERSPPRDRSPQRGLWPREKAAEDLLVNERQRRELGQEQE